MELNSLNKHIDFADVFPFYLLVNLSDSKIEECGRLYKKINKDLVGVDFNVEFELLIPKSEKLEKKLFRKSKDKNIQIKHIVSGIILRGGLKLIEDESKVLITVQPWFSTTSDFANRNLRFSDFHPISNTPDIVQLLQMLNISLGEEAQQKNLLDNILRQSNLGICQFNDKDEKLYSNRRYRKIINLLSEEDQQIVNHKLSKSFRDKVEEIVVVDSDSICFEFDFRKTADTFLVLVKDITEKLKYEKTVKEKELLDIKSAFVSSFLANMSHEIRTPLNGIIGILDVFSLTSMTATQEEYLKHIKSSSDSLLKIINDVLDLSKVESGRFEIKPIKFNIEEALEESKNLFDSIAKSKRNKIVINFSKNLKNIVELDKVRYQQILNNLISNANKFTEKGNIVINVEKSDGFLITSVKDEGIGIKESDFDKLFVEFSQIDNTYTKEVEGTGLGLSICKRLTNLMGGTIKCESEYNKGSTFTFLVRFNEIENQENYQIEKNSRKEGLLQNKRVLLVDDKLINQKVAMLMLKSFGCSIDLANNGLECLELFEPRKYDFILMDIQMPLMDGLEATKRLISDYTDVPPIIALSANAMEGDREKYLENGMSGYIAKPVTKDKLYSGILQYL